MNSRRAADNGTHLEVVVTLSCLHVSSHGVDGERQTLAALISKVPIGRK